MVIILQNIPRDSPCCTRRHILHKVLSPLGDSYRCSYCCFCKYLPVLPMGIALPKIYATLWLYKHSKFKNEKQALFYLSKNQQVTLESECPEPLSLAEETTATPCQCNPNRGDTAEEGATTSVCCNYQLPVFKVIEGKAEKNFFFPLKYCTISEEVDGLQVWSRVMSLCSCSCVFYFSPEDNDRQCT